MTQLQLVRSNNGRNATSLSAVKCRMLSVVSTKLPPRLLKNLERLHQLRPAAVLVIERLVEDTLDDLEGRRP